MIRKISGDAQREFARALSFFDGKEIAKIQGNAVSRGRFPLRQSESDDQHGGAAESKPIKSGDLTMKLRVRH